MKLVHNHEMVPSSSAKSPMSAAHKEALAVGREQSRAVKAYLEAIDAHRPRRGRQRTAESIAKQLEAIEAKLAAADPLARLQLVQDRIDLQRELAAKSATVDLTEVEAEFVKVAGDYARRKGISYAAWREAGVDAAVLKRAGIGRGTA
jgi:hypothetical protein